MAFNMDNSAALFDRASKILVEGVGSGSRGALNFTPYPPYIREGKGAHLIDVDGNEYIDWMLSFGALPMGHAHPRIVDVVREEVARGTHSATALEVEVDVAEMLVSILPNAEMIRFANTGTEACMAGVRLARGLTGRNKIIKFEGHYHGWYDGLLVSSNPQFNTTLGHRNDPVRIPDSSGLTPGSWEDVIVAPWNDESAIESVMESHGKQVACIITEGVMANMGVIPPKPGYLKRIQELCRHYGALFYLDETVTGFRVAAGGCAELYDLKPDITSYGKALGQGFPIAAIAGSKEVMEGFEYGKVLHYGTHNSPRLGLHATKTMLEEMLKNNQAGFKKLRELGDRMVERIREIAKVSNRHQILVQNVGSIFQIYFTEAESIDDYRAYCRHVDHEKFKEMVNRLRLHGVFMSPANTLHSLSCTQHTDQNIEDTANAIGNVLDQM